MMQLMIYKDNSIMKHTQVLQEPTRNNCYLRLDHFVQRPLDKIENIHYGSMEACSRLNWESSKYILTTLKLMS